jgi:hypothetical protein
MANACTTSTKCSTSMKEMIAAWTAGIVAAELEQQAVVEARCRSEQRPC